jgi:hypothetical protein
MKLSDMSGAMMIASRQTRHECSDYIQQKPKRQYAEESE